MVLAAVVKFPVQPTTPMIDTATELSAPACIKPLTRMPNF